MLFTVGENKLIHVFLECPHVAKGTPRTFYLDDPNYARFCGLCRTKLAWTYRHLGRKG